jgi:hypothetical protein
MRFLHFASPRGGFTFDVSGDLDFAQQLSGNAKDVQKAQKRVLGTLRRRLKTEARRDIQREYSLKAQAINERLSVSNKYDGVALVGRASGINLINFRARQTRRGVSYSVRKGQRRTLAHAFIQRTRSGRGPFVWMRKYASDASRNAVGGRYGGASHPSKDRFSSRHGYPIFQRYGPNVAQMLKGGGRPQRIVEFAQQTIEKELSRLLGPKS